MRRPKSVFRTALSGLLFAGGFHAESSGAVLSPPVGLEQERARIEQVVHDYLAGFRDADRSAFDHVFAPGSILITRVQGGHAAVTVTAASERLSNWSSNPDSDARVDNLRIDFTSENLAKAGFQLRYLGRTYNDLLSLYRFNDAWLVAVKVTEVGE